MNDAMPRQRWPHLLREVSRHRTVTWVVRVGHGPRTRLKAAYGTPEFETEYHAAIRGEPVSGRRKGVAGTLQWLWDRHHELSAWKALAPATRRQRENIMRGVLEDCGAMPLSVLARSHIVDGRERRSKTPSAANHFLNTMRALFSWAVECEILTKDPTEGVKHVARPLGGFRAWTEAEIDSFEARWPIGTRERLAFAILLYTGLRRGDAAVLGRQHVSEDVILMRAEKTNTQLTIPILPELAHVIASTKTGDLTFIATASGGPMAKELFGNWFRETCDAAGISASAHGLRKAGAARLASNGATVAQLEAIFGWSGGRMAALYTRSADRMKLAKDAIGKLSRSKR